MKDLTGKSNSVNNFAETACLALPLVWHLLCCGWLKQAALFY